MNRWQHSISSKSTDDKTPAAYNKYSYGLKQHATNVNKARGATQQLMAQTAICQSVNTNAKTTAERARSAAPIQYNSFSFIKNSF